MGIEVKGLEDLLKTTEALGTFGKNIESSSLRRAMKPGLSTIKSYAPKDSSNSSNALKINKIKKYKSGSLWGSMGIDKSNWEVAKPIYFQHYGYHNWGQNGIWKGMYIDKHAGWFDRAIDSSESVILDSLEKEINSKLDKIFK
ncbi:hypothetical protein [Cetobacterium sp.]|uniref:hypothetical protein n=1 Tax=Cetobacterium sp. TaxID=2071632 RepID=UPI003EE59444